MIAAAVLAGLSALTGALTIRPRTTPNVPALQVSK